MTRRAVLAAGVAVLVVAGAFAARYQRQIWSYLTHWKGAPSTTWAYEPFPEDPRLRIAVAGDVGDSGTRLDRTGTEMATLSGTAHPYDVLLLLGDNVYPSGDPARLPATVFEPFAGVLDSGADLLAILGNHDVKGGFGDDQMSALGMPGRWWSRTYGDLLIVGLDSNDLGSDQQRAWLEDTLAATTARWRVVALHHPPYSAGYQGSSVDVRERYAPVFERYGVQLVLSGHEHDYQRSVPIDGVTYVISGGGAGTRRTGEDWFTAVSFSWHHFLDVAVFDDRLVVRAVNQEGQVADELVLTASPAAP